MSFNAVGNMAPVGYQRYNMVPTAYNRPDFNKVSNVYSSDSARFRTLDADPKPPFDPDLPPEPYKQNFFDRPEVRLGGMVLATGAVGGGIGYAIGSSLGRAGLGAAIGAGIGVLAPVALLAFALYSWGKGH